MLHITLRQRSQQRSDKIPERLPPNPLQAAKYLSPVEPIMKSPAFSLPFAIVLLTAFGLSSSVTGTRPADNPSGQPNANPEASSPLANARRPVLQIINGSVQTIEVYWLKSADERIANGRIKPGQNKLITTTLGHRFAVVGQRDHTEITVTSVVPVQAVRLLSLIHI